MEKESETSAAASQGEPTLDASNTNELKLACTTTKADDFTEGRRSRQMGGERSEPPAHDASAPVATPGEPAEGGLRARAGTVQGNVGTQSPQSTEKLPGIQDLRHRARKVGIADARVNELAPPGKKPTNAAKRQLLRLIEMKRARDSASNTDHEANSALSPDVASVEHGGGNGMPEGVSTPLEGADSGTRAGPAIDVSCESSAALDEAVPLSSGDAAVPGVSDQREDGVDAAADQSASHSVADIDSVECPGPGDAAGGVDSHLDDDVPADQLRAEVQSRWGSLRAAWIVFALVVEQVYRKESWKAWEHSSFAGYVRDELHEGPATIMKMIRAVKYLRTKAPSQLKKIKALLRKNDPRDRPRLASYVDLDEVRRLEARHESAEVTATSETIDEIRARVLGCELSGAALRAKIKELPRAVDGKTEGEQADGTAEQASESHDGSVQPVPTANIEAASSDLGAESVVVEGPDTDTEVVSAEANTDVNTVSGPAEVPSSDLEEEAQLAEATEVEAEPTDVTGGPTEAEPTACDAAHREHPREPAFAAASGPDERLKQCLTALQGVVENPVTGCLTPSMRTTLKAMEAAVAALLSRPDLSEPSPRRGTA